MTRSSLNVTYLLSFALLLSAFLPGFGFAHEKDQDFVLGTRNIEQVSGDFVIHVDYVTEPILVNNPTKFNVTLTHQDDGRIARSVEAITYELRDGSRIVHSGTLDGSVSTNNEILFLTFPVEATYRLTLKFRDAEDKVLADTEISLFVSESILEPLLRNIYIVGLSGALVGILFLLILQAYMQYFRNNQGGVKESFIRKY